MITLKFNSDKLYEDLVNECLIESANEAIESVSKYIKRGLISNQDIQKRTLTPVEVEKAFYDESAKKISAFCASYGWSILVSFGTGIYIDRSSETNNKKELAEYIGGKLWNPSRRTFRIVGRPKGKYNSVIGQRYSKGKKNGKPISGWRTLRKGIKPNYAIQNAEKRLERGLKEGGFVHRILEKNMEIFIKKHPLSEYLYNVDE